MRIFKKEFLGLKVHSNFQNQQRNKLFHNTNLKMRMINKNQLYLKMIESLWAILLFGVIFMIKFLNNTQ